MPHTKATAPTSFETTPNKHQQKAEATRRKLLKSAQRIFARDGFEAARIEDIAAEAGHSRGAFYAHFAQKEDLFFALVEEQAQKHREHMRSVLEKCASDEERLEALRTYYANRVSDRQWSILVLEFKLYALRHPKLRAKLAKMYRSIRLKMKWDGLERIWPEQLRCSAEEVDVRKLALHVMLNGFALERAYDPTSLPEAEVAELLRKLFDFIMTY